MKVNKLLKIIFHIIIFVLLTVLTQIGGILFIVVIFLFRKDANRRKLKQFALFILLYLFSTFIIVPNLAPIFGREKIKNTEFIQAHSFFFKLANRNYVKPELNNAMQKIAIKLNENHTGIKLIYLDANFPFFNKFPLLPHLSHNDGKKIDISLIYENKNGGLTNKKKSISGYGTFEAPTNSEYNQVSVCKNKGHWQYDYSKFLSFGSINSEINFSTNGTRTLINLILNNNEVEKLFIEPHLKNRLNLTNNKVRFHGCYAVRHDDHIHFQIK